MYQLEVILKPLTGLKHESVFVRIHVHECVRDKCKGNSLVRCSSTPGSDKLMCLCHLS